MSGKIQFKLVVDPRTKDIVSMHAAANRKTMSETIETVAEEVLFGELTGPDRAEIHTRDLARNPDKT